MENKIPLIKNDASKTEEIQKPKPENTPIQRKKEINIEPSKVQQAKENLPSDKIYVLPDYKTNCSTVGKNIYHVKTTVSDLKDEDFAKAAEEYKNNISKNKGNYDDKSIYE